MKDQDTITFDSGDGATVSLYFVDVANIEESMEKLHAKLIKASYKKELDEHAVQ